MPVLPQQSNASIVLARNTTAPPDAVDLSAPLLALFSLVLMLLITPPMLWHARNRNIGATALIIWLIILLLFTFTNSILWNTDNIDSWFNGVGLCDVEVKIQLASQVALPACIACMLRALAAVLDTDRATLVPTNAQRRRNNAIDIVCCVGFPLLQMPMHYIVQSARYYIFSVVGCVPAVSPSWLSVLLLVVPPILWTLVDAYYAVLILIRLYRYRRSFSTILTSTKTTKSRFIRLYLLCVVFILGAIPAGAYVLHVNIVVLAQTPFSWKDTHSPGSWTNVIMVPSGGVVFYDRWIWLGNGAAAFIFFGVGKEALDMYRTGLLTVGLGGIFPSLKSDRHGSTTTTFESFSSRAKLLFKRTSASLSWTSDSLMSSKSDEVCPRSAALSADDVALCTDEKSLEDDDRNRGSKASALSKLLSMLGLHKKTQSESGSLPVPALTMQRETVRSAVVSAPRTLSLAQHVRSINSDELIMRREVRQGSEHEMTGIQ